MNNSQSNIVSLSISLALLLSGAAYSSVAAFENTKGGKAENTASTKDAKTATAAISQEDLRNVKCCLPSLGDGGDSLVQLKDYEFHSDEYPFVKLRARATGILEGKPAAVAEVTWNTGGSGNWSTIVLFRRLDGQVRGEWFYTPGTDLPKGGTYVSRIEIKNNKIYLYGEAPMENRKISTPLVAKAAKFEHYSQD